MAQLTGSQLGTGQSDLFVGELNLIDLSESTTESGILFANINAFGGDDTIEGTSTLTPLDAGTTPTNIELISYGIQQSPIDTGNGNDAVIGTGNSSGFGSGQNGKATSYGFARGSVSGRGGDDNFTFTGNTRGAGISTSTGLSTATVDGGSGNDTITLTAKAEAFSRGGNGSVATG